MLGTDHVALRRGTSLEIADGEVLHRGLGADLCSERVHRRGCFAGEPDVHGAGCFASGDVDDRDAQITLIKLAC